MSQRRLLSLLLLAPLLFLACRKNAAPEAKSEPTSAQSLAKAAEATLSRMEREPARWTATHQMESGDRMEVTILRQGERRRIDFALLREDTRAPLTHIVEQDGLWFVRDGEISGVYRPYMAPLRAPALYMFLARSELQFFTEAGAGEIGELQGVSDGVATFRLPFPEDVTAALEQRAAMAEEAEASEAAEEARAAIRTGLETGVHVERGVIAQAGLPGLQTLVEGPQFLESVDADAFDTGDLAPGILTASLEGETDALVMIGHCLMWRPGQPPCDLDTHLLDLNRGSLRRVPFSSGTSLPGAFLKNRIEVVVVGAGISGGMRPYRVHLNAGAQLPLGGRSLDTGVTLFPRLSPDGESLVATWTPSMGIHQAARVVRFDTRGGEATTIGEPMAHSHVQWLPDGRGVLLVLREQQPPADGSDQAPVQKPVLAKMELDGTIQRLRDGDQPLIIGEDALIFFDVETRRWRRSKLDGTAAQTFGSGHPDLSHPTLAPDGKSLLFMQRAGNGAMEPVRVDIGGQAVTSVAPEHGLWAWPVW